MKKLKSLLFYSAAAVFALTSCEEEKKNTEEVTPTTLKGQITSDKELTSDKVWYLDGRVTVTGGATLKIQPGTIIKASAGSGANASALLIAVDGKIMAEGTAAEPIIFTSDSDKIEPGQIVSPNMSEEQQGFWGGVIILGDAPISASAAQVQIEGIPTSDTKGLYGGSNDKHDAGVFKYVSIRHGGTNIGSGNEINGLTLGGVGKATQISHVEIVANQDDGVEFFGGDVNVSNVLVWKNGDDAIDTDQEWKGTIDGGIIVKPGDRAFELDGPEGAVTGGNHTIKNFTVYMDGGVELIDFDDNTNVDMSNIYFYGLEAGQVISGYSGFAAAAKGSLSNVEVTLGGLVLGDIFGSFSAVVSVNANANTVGPKNDADYKWTMASQTGALAEIGL